MKVVELLPAAEFVEKPSANEVILGFSPVIPDDLKQFVVGHRVRLVAVDDFEFFICRCVSHMARMADAL